MNLILKLILVIKTINNFHTAIFDRIGIMHGEVTYYLKKNNLKFIARAGSEDLSEIVVVGSGSEYKLDLINLSKNPTIVDLGGHIGSFSIPLARKLKNKCKIYTFEPDKNNYELLKRNIKLNNIKSITSYNYAIGAKNGIGYLKNKNINNDAYHLSDSKKDSTECEIKTLKKMFGNKKIDLLKMDIEGGEYKIINHKESFKFIKENVNYIFIEHHPISKKYNGLYVRELLSKSFNVIYENTNTITFENKKIN